jgi:ABC-2 type transport system ATP-binding protein
MGNPIANVANLRFEDPGVRALDDVSFELERGTVTALVGPNGAGKSTLLRCMAALETPVFGEIDVAGVDVLEAPREAHRRLGYLSDFFGVYELLTVRQCLAHAAAIHGMTDERVSEAVDRVAGELGLADRLEVAAGTLSRGLRQRLAIGQSMVHAPQLLLLDEPAAGLDPEARHALASLFRKLQASGMTLMVSSHILAELDEYSTHMLVLQQGRMVEHRRVHAADGAAGRRLRVVLATADERLPALLASRASLGNVVVEGRAASFDFQGDAEAQAGLLRALVSAGLAVAAFEEARENLHDSYLRTMRRESP